MPARHNKVRHSSRLVNITAIYLSACHPEILLSVVQSVAVYVVNVTLPAPQDLSVQILLLYPTALGVTLGVVVRKTRIWNNYVPRQVTQTFEVLIVQQETIIRTVSSR